MTRQKNDVIFLLVSVIGDLILLNAGFLAAFLIRYAGELPENNFTPYVNLTPWISTAALVLFGVYGLYSSRRRPWFEIFYSVITANLMIFATTVIMSYFSKGYAFPRSVFLISLGLHMLVLTTWRYFLWRIGRRNLGGEGILIVGTYAEANALNAKIGKYYPGFYRVEGFILGVEAGPTTDTAGQVAATTSPLPRVLGTLSNLRDVLSESGAKVVLVGASVGPAARADVATACLETNRWIWLVPDLYEIVCCQARLSRVDDTPVFEAGGPPGASPAALGKRVVDLAFSIIGLVLALPIMALVALAIKLESRGPVLYFQERVSENGRIFKLVKFRTMVTDAEKLTGPVLASRNDPRVTRVGGLIRATRIDELPQLINVIMGDMSLVGPRPERPYFVDHFAQQIPNYEERHKVKPGLTGLAQVEGKYSTTPDDKLRYDLLYSRRYSPLMDLKILFQTVRTLMMKDKAT